MWLSKRVLHAAIELLSLEPDGSLDLRYQLQERVVGLRLNLAVDQLSGLAGELLGRALVAARLSARIAEVGQVDSRVGVGLVQDHEVGALRTSLGGSFVLLAPGIRPAGEAAGDQKRVATPLQAVQAGASYLVVGRPITAAPDPVAAAQAIVREMMG